MCHLHFGERFGVAITVCICFSVLCKRKQRIHIQVLVLQEVGALSGKQEPHCRFGWQPSLICWGRVLVRASGQAQLWGQTCPRDRRGLGLDFPVFWFMPLSSAEMPSRTPSCSQSSHYLVCFGLRQFPGEVSLHLGVSDVLVTRPGYWGKIPEGKSSSQVVLGLEHQWLCWPWHLVKQVFSRFLY